MIDSTVISIIISLLGGTGGIVGLLTWWNQRRTGVRQEDRADDEAFSRRTNELLKTQIEYVVTPLKDELARQKTNSEEQEQDLKDVRKELKEVKDQVESTRTRYWQAIGYIRQLLNWYRTHVPPEVASPPDIPPELITDI